MEATSYESGGTIAEKLIEKAKTRGSWAAGCLYPRNYITPPAPKPHGSRGTVEPTRVEGANGGKDLREMTGRKTGDYVGWGSGVWPCCGE